MCGNENENASNADLRPCKKNLPTRQCVLPVTKRRDAFSINNGSAVPFLFLLPSISACIMSLGWDKAFETSEAAFNIYTY